MIKGVSQVLEKKMKGFGQFHMLSAAEELGYQGYVLWFFQVATSLPIRVLRN